MGRPAISEFDSYIELIREYLSDGRMRHRLDIGDELVRHGFSKPNTYGTANHIMWLLKAEGYAEQVLMKGRQKGYWRKCKPKLQAIAA